jgi:hypothetical protein
MLTVEWQVGKMEAELREWGARLEELEATVDDTAGTGAKSDYRACLDDLREKYAAAEARLAALKAAGRGRWDTSKRASKPPGASSRRRSRSWRTRRGEPCHGPSRSSSC